MIDTAARSASPPADAAPLKLALVFAMLFVAYQLPEGLGARTLDSFPVQAALMLAFLPIAWLAGRSLGYRGLDAWYMGRSPRWTLLLGSCFALSVLATAAALAGGAALGVYRLTPAGHAGAAALVPGALWLLFQTFFPSVAEDIVTRGFLMRAMPSLSRRWLFVPISACLYVLNHIYRLANGPSEWLMLFCFGLAYSAALFYSRSLWAAIGLHWGWNFAGAFAGELVTTDKLAPALHPLVLAAVNVLMLAIVVAVGSRAARRRALPRPHPA